MRPSIKYYVLYVVLCLAHLIPWQGVPPYFHSVTKALPILMLLVLTLSGPGERHDKWMPVALVFSLCGDIVSEIGALGQLSFILQILSFLFAQIAYTLAFRKYCTHVNDGYMGLRTALGLFLVIELSTVAFLSVKGILERNMGIPLLLAALAYVLCIGTMVYTSVSQRRSGYVLFAVGAVLFLISDSLIAINAFVIPIPARALAVMSTYYAAQLLLNHKVFEN